jgi:hypothetical protein
MIRSGNNQSPEGERMADLSKADEARVRQMELTIAENQGSLKTLGRILTYAVPIAFALLTSFVGYVFVTTNTTDKAATRNSDKLADLERRHADEVADLKRRIVKLEDFITPKAGHFAPGIGSPEGKVVTFQPGKVTLRIKDKDETFNLATDAKFYLDYTKATPDNARRLGGSTAYFIVSPDDTATITAINVVTKKLPN